MCGICGITSFDGITNDEQLTVKRMMDRLAHRGPDDEGFIKGDNFIFGHRRLSIIDLENGKQPMQSEDGQITLIYNGEIYNYIEIRQELSRQGFHFKTFSDTEVILKLYEKEGEKCVEHLNGMFAFAIFDQRNQRFFAARDHFGIKPFYYTITSDGVMVFASEIKAVLEHPKVTIALNMEAFNEYMTFQFCLNSKTLFDGITKLEPGCFLTFNLHKKSEPLIHRYWKLDFNIDTYHTEEYFLDTLLLLLQDSMRQQLRSDVPIGAYLSGGIDSSTVVTLAAKQYGKGFKCFTGKFETPAYDESKYAFLVSENIGGILHEIVPTADDFINYLPKLIYHLDEPVAGPGVFPQYIVSKLAAGSVKVVLGGQGGDEVFGGYARYLVAYLEQCLKGAIYETQEEGSHIVSLNSMIPSLPLLREYVPMLKEFWQDGLFEPMDTRYMRLINRSNQVEKLLSPNMKQSLNKEKLVSEFSQVFNGPETKSYINKMLNFDQKTLLPALLQIEDRVSMAVSIESRAPLLDYRIVQLANSMPPKVKFKNGQPKWALRQAMKNILPEPIVNRRDKMGFPVPLNDWIRLGKVRDFVSDLLLSTSSRQRGIFDNREIENLLNNEKPFGRQIWGVLCLELWFQTFMDGYRK